MTATFAERTAGIEQFQPRYDLEHSEIADITRAYLNDPENNLPRGRLVGVLVDYDTDIANAARTTEREIFEEVFPSNDAAFMAEEYSAVEDNSRFFMVLDRKENTVAVVSRIQDDPGSEEGEYKSLNDAVEAIGKTKQDVYNHHKIDPREKAWDVLTLAARPEYRRSNMASAKATSMVLRMLGRQADHEKVQHGYTIIDEKALRAIRAMGVVMEPMCGIKEPFQYLDSERSYATYIDAPRFMSHIGEHAQDLRESAKLRDIFKLGIEKFMKRRALAKIAGNLATGKGLDKHIVLPDLAKAA